MNNCTITVNAAHFAAALHLASKKDVRYYLNGVLVEGMENETRCAATDGHVLGVARARSENGMGGQDVVTLIVPRDIAELIVKTTKGKGLFNLCHLDGKWTAETVRGGFGFAPIDGRFPDYRMVIPTDLNNEPSQFDPELMARFGKVGKSLGVKPHPTVHHNGEAGACRVVFDGRDDFLGVIMPLRIKNAVGQDITWGKVYPQKTTLANAA